MWDTLSFSHAEEGAQTVSTPVKRKKGLTQSQWGEGGAQRFGPTIFCFSLCIT